LNIQLSVSIDVRRSRGPVVTFRGVSYSVTSRRHDGRDVFDSEDVSALAEMFDELDVHPRLRRPLSVRHNEIKITLTALPTGRLVLQADGEPDQYMIDAAADRVAVELLYAVARGNVARLMAERWKPYAAYCS
jgi:hypothetical protein